MLYGKELTVFSDGLHSPRQAISLKSARIHKVEDISEEKRKNISDPFSHTCCYSPAMPVIQQMLLQVFWVLSL